jgi:hypothetical protein
MKCHTKHSVRRVEGRLIHVTRIQKNPLVRIVNMPRSGCYSAGQVLERFGAAGGLTQGRQVSFLCLFMTRLAFYFLGGKNKQCFHQFMTQYLAAARNMENHQSINPRRLTPKFEVACLGTTFTDSCSLQTSHCQ